MARARALAAIPGSARRHAIFCQVAAEAAFAAGEVEDGFLLLGRTIEVGLFDLHWLDRCPLLDCARGDPRFGAQRAIVTTRAHAIEGALHGE